MADIQKEEIRKIVSEQARKMKAFLSENLPPSAQNGPVEIQITPENCVISPDQYPPELEKRVVTFKDIATLKEVAGIPDELHRMGAVKWEDREGVSRFLLFSPKCFAKRDNLIMLHAGAKPMRL